MNRLDDLLAKAYHAPNGEMAWELSDATEAAQALAAAGYVIVGGEVWCVLEDGTIYGMIPAFAVCDGGPSGVYHWMCEPSRRQTAETWEQFCTRAARYTIEVLEERNVEKRVVPEMVPTIRYNLTYFSEAEE